jgi:hypothetical protein
MAKIKIEALEPARKEFLRKRFKEWYVRGWKALLQKLLAHGGEMMVPQPEPKHFVSRLNREGRRFRPKKVVGRRGQANGCHANSARIWAQDPAALQLISGYALSDDGLWRQHSWLWREKDSVIVETTCKFLAYFGVRLSGIDAMDFVFDNAADLLGPDRTPPALLSFVRAIWGETSDGRKEARTAATMRSANKRGECRWGRQ